MSRGPEGVLWEHDIDPRILWRVYETESWVNAAVQEIVKWVVGEGFEIRAVPEVENPSDEEKKRLAEFLKKPNGDDTFEDLLEDIVTDLLVVGDSYLEKARVVEGETVTKELGAIFPLDSLRIQVRTDENGNVIEYIQKPVDEEGEKGEPIPAENVTHFKLNARGKTVFGRSKLKAALLPVMTDLFSQTWNRTFFENFASPRRVWKLPETLEQKQIDFNRAQLTEFKGPDNAHKDMVVLGDVKSETIDITPKDMEFLNLRRFNREEILAVIGVPPALVGIIEAGNIGGGTGDSQIKKFRIGTVLPVRRKVMQKINADIVRKELKIEGWIVAIKDPDPPADLDRARTESIYVDSGIKTIDEARAVISLPPKQAEQKQEPGEALDVASPEAEIKPIPEIANLDPAIEKTAAGILKTLRRWRDRVLARFDRLTKTEKQELDPDEFKQDIVEENLRVEMAAGLGTAALLASRDAARKGGVAVDQAVAQARPLAEARAAQFSSRFTAEFGSALTDTINDAVRRGEPIPVIRQEIEGFFDRPKTFTVAETLDPVTGVVIRRGHERTLDPQTYSQMVARTEGANVASSASAMSFQSAGITKLRWRTARTRVDLRICRPQNNQVFEADEVLANNPIPAHPNCRCAWLPALPDAPVTGSVAAVPQV